MHTQRVRNYYNRNTSLFLAWGREQHTRSMHRAVWAAGVPDIDAALRYVNHRIAQLARKHAPQTGAALRILDLGCGVGGTLFDLHKQLYADGIQLDGLGVSISQAQVRIAQRMAYTRHVPLHFVEANFLELPFTADFDLVIGIESFVHASNPAALYAAAAAVLRPSGRLVICDDFLCDNSADQVLKQAFQRGWLAAGLVTAEQAIHHAQAAGLHLIEQHDLTPDLHLLHWPDVFVRALLHVGLHLPLEWTLMQNFVGGLALQHGLMQGVFAYRWMVFERGEG